MGKGYYEVDYMNGSVRSMIELDSLSAIHDFGQEYGINVLDWKWIELGEKQDNWL